MLWWELGVIYIAQGYTLEKWCHYSLPRLSINKLAIIQPKCGISVFNHGCLQECQRILKNQVGEKLGLPRVIRWSRGTLFYFIFFICPLQSLSSPTPHSCTLTVHHQKKKSSKGRKLEGPQISAASWLAPEFLTTKITFYKCICLLEILTQAKPSSKCSKCWAALS